MVTPQKPLPSSAPSATALLFASALFVSAFLLFLVEPIVARMVLPALGGTPMVWNGCMLVFQTLLLAGYACSHGASVWLRPAGRAASYVALLVLPFAFLPIAITPSEAATVHPLAWLLWVLIGSIGAPFFVLATSTSSLQQAFADTGHARGRDPYFLYVASNAGSLVGLLAYPLVVERLLTLHEQSRLWAIGYTGFAVLAATCMGASWRMRRTTHAAIAPADPPAPLLTAGRRARWVALATIPSSLMLGVTAYLATDIASFPLLWIVPLALYLITFILAFSRPAASRAVADRRLPILLVTVAVFILLNAGAPLWLIVPVHLVTFVLAALLCHATLAEDRPPASQLTEFYLWIAVGGVLGGLFNTIVAPMAFTSVVEYPIALVLAAFMRQTTTTAAGGSAQTRTDAILAVGVAALTLASVIGIQHFGGPPRAAFLAPALLCFSQMRHARRFAMATAAMLIVGLLLPYGTVYGQVLLARRTFFGVYRVSRDPAGVYYSLYHGTTLHGLEAIDPARAGEPLTYYHRAGPFGQAFAALPGLAAARDVAAVGLGIGALASYATAGQHWTFFEIDPEVERLARDARYFHHLETCGAACTVVVGDARLSLARPETGTFGLIVLDAFSSDAIPVHLITNEALSLYLSHLAPGGVLAFHISNRHLRLGPILARLGAEHGLTVIEQQDQHAVDIDEHGMTTSDWLLMARAPDDLAPLTQDRRWFRPPVSSSTPLWTDDFSNILSVFNFGE